MKRKKRKMRTHLCRSHGVFALINQAHQLQRQTNIKRNKRKVNGINVNNNDFCARCYIAYSLCIDLAFSIATLFFFLSFFAHVFASSIFRIDPMKLQRSKHSSDSRKIGNEQKNQPKRLNVKTHTILMRKFLFNGI